MHIVSRRGLFLELVVLLFATEVACAQTVDQAGLVGQYDQAVVIQNAAIDKLAALSQKSAAVEFQRIITTGGDALAAGTEALGFARVNVVAAGKTATAYSQALREGRLMDAQTLASLWSKQAGVARDYLTQWGQQLAVAATAIDAASRWLMK